MRVLDLFCGAGGASVGYARSGLEIVGVDIKPQPNYPFAFMRRDVMTMTYDDLKGYDLIHASPPCQAYSVASAKHRANGVVYDDLVHRVRGMLVASGTHYVIENVPGSPLRHSVRLCGSMFGLNVRRHRHFETSFSIAGSMICQHEYQELIYTVAGHSLGTLAQWREAMGIAYMTRKELTQAIPPAYTHWIAGQFLDAVL